MKEETLLEQMTRVRPEVLNEETLKLFNKIMEVIDERDGLQQRITRAIEYIGNKNIGVPRKTREKAIKILRGLDDE